MKRLTVVALVAFELVSTPAHAGFFKKAGKFVKKGWDAGTSIAIAPAKVVVDVIKNVDDKSPLETIRDGALLGVNMPKATLDKTIDTVNDVVEKNPSLKEKVVDKQIVVSIPMNGESSPVGSGTTSVEAASVPPREVESRSPAESLSQQAASTSNSAIVGHIGQQTPRLGEIGVLVAMVPVLKNREIKGPGPQLGPVYGPSQIGVSTPEAPLQAPKVPVEHPNKDAYFSLEATVEVAMNALEQPMPKVTSAHRMQSSAHRRAALDLETTSLELAQKLSEYLGAGYMAQVELVNTPEPGWQTDHRFVCGKQYKTAVWKPNKENSGASGSHVHVQLNDPAKPIPCP